ncbi:MAG: ATP-binding protein [Candidatus Omnitrophica bacterium]|nr:ATP-binding protein [Candidatus Omnitrophota bacterium]
MIKRSIEETVMKLPGDFPVIAITGPSQSGKTTLAKKVFPNKPYALLDDPETSRFATSDPMGFLSQFPEGAIIDEIQKAPQLFSYLQGTIDSRGTAGMFVLVGSQNFMLTENVTPSLAGRVATVKLLPFSLEELATVDMFYERYEDCLFNGMFPKLYISDIAATDFYADYVSLYIGRDLLQMKKVHDLSSFHTFLKMCALRTGQLVNLSSIADDCGISHNTAGAWISLLEASSIIFLLRPHHKNFNKRLVKVPKMYFTDTGLAAYLAGVLNAEHLANHPLKGPLFENFIICELLKERLNAGREPNLYFWRDKLGHEIDCLIDNEGELFPMEIKSGRTVSEDYFKNILYWNKLSGGKSENATVVYGGAEDQKRNSTNVLSWNNLNSF